MGKFPHPPIHDPTIINLWPKMEMGAGIQATMGRGMGGRGVVVLYWHLNHFEWPVTRDIFVACRMIEYGASDSDICTKSE